VQEYAKAIVQYLDPGQELISGLLTREDCVKTSEETSLKDLRVLGRPLEEVVIVDNSIVSYLGQLDNGIPIIPFYNYKQDSELPQLQEFLLDMVLREKDVRKHIRKYFHYDEMLQEEDSQALF
jgi:CTD small phosphatase-like protein 2